MLTIYEEEQLDYWVWGPATRAVTWRRPTPNPLTRWAIQMNFLKASSYTVLSSRFGHQNSLPALPQRSCLGLLPCNLRELLVHLSSSTAARTAPVTVMYPSSCAAHSDLGICSTIGMGWSISPLTAGKTFVAVQLTAPFWGPPLIDGGGRVSSMFYHTASRPELGVSHPLMACLLQEGRNGCLEPSFRSTAFDTPRMKCSIEPCPSGSQWSMAPLTPAPLGVAAVNRIAHELYPESPHSSWQAWHHYARHVEIWPGHGRFPHAAGYSSGMQWYTTSIWG